MHEHAGGCWSGWKGTAATRSRVVSVQKDRMMKVVYRHKERNPHPQTENVIDFRNCEARRYRYWSSGRQPAEIKLRRGVAKF